MAQDTSRPGTGESPRRILLMDCDAFFVQVARMVDPEGAGKARYLLVGGRPEARGVVCSASYATRRFGVRSAMPMATALRRCPQAMVVPVPRRECTRKSREIREVLERFAPVVEPASIDEAYLDLTGTERLYGGEPLEATAERIRQAVLEATGVHVSIGGGTNRMIAKLAVSEAKPAGVHVVPPGGEAAFMRRLELRDIPGVGPKFAERLARQGLRRVVDVLGYERDALVQLFGPRTGRWLYDRVRGVDPTPVEARTPAKSISREETFARDLNDDEALERVLLELTLRAAADLRAKGRTARTVTVRIRDADFRTRQASRTLPRPVESDRGIFEAARPLFRRLRAERRMGVRLLGVGVSQLSDPSEPPQLELFGGDVGEEPEQERDRALSRTLDSLRNRFGRDAVLPARVLPAAEEGEDADPGTG